MTVKELIEQLRLAKNKEAEVVFRLGTTTLEVDVMAEVVKENNTVRFPSLGESTNAVAIKLNGDASVEEVEMTND
jgi:dihydroxyacetone kinase DhaKLM complex PTS-EIIA-like component DhaM